jgi:ABC-type nitrate/sulfonate/bicarbonate transport system substrate-binding protein
MKFRNVGVASTAAIIMLTAGCSSESGNTPLNVEKANIVVPAFPSIDPASLYITQMDGLFADQGLNVTIEPAQAWATKYPTTLEAFTRALSRGQQIADTDRAAVAFAVEKYLHITPATAAFLSLPSFPTGVDAVRLQRVVSAMLRFGLLPEKDTSFKIQAMTGG